MAKLRNYARDVETGDPFTTGNATITGPDGSTLATPALNGTTGAWEYQANGQPGVMTQEYTAADQTKIVAGDAYGQAGDWCEGELSRILQLFGDGVINDMTVTAPGSMNVQVGTGNLLNLGVLHPIYTAENVTIGTADGSNPRIDRVVSRLTRTGTFAGKVVLAVVAGTAAATPSVPALTQDANTWEVEVARVTVPAAASSIVLGNISTAERPIATGPVADGSVGTTALDDEAVTTAKLADGAVTVAKIAAGTTLPFLLPGLIATYWYSAHNILTGDSGSLLIDQNTIYAAPLFVPKATTLTGLAVEVLQRSVASGTGRVGLYEADSDGLPGALFYDGGTLDFATIGIKSVTGLSVDLPAGWYWGAICAGTFSGVLALQTMVADADNPVRSLLGSPDPATRPDEWAAVGAHVGTSALPDPFPAPGITDPGPNVWFQTSGT